MRLAPTMMFCVALLPANALGQSSEFAPMVLNGYSSLPPKFRVAKVFAQDGTLVGNVQRIERGPDGRFTQIVVGISGPRVISLAAHNASWDDPTNSIVIDSEAMKAALESR